MMKRIKSVKSTAAVLLALTIFASGLALVSCGEGKSASAAKSSDE